MLSVRREKAIEAPWLNIVPIVVGPVPSGRGTPDVYILVEQGGDPFRRIDVYYECAGQGPFIELVLWNQLVAFGAAGAAHLVDPVSGETGSVKCDGYFGHFYSSNDALLVATATQLICLDDLRRIRWRSEVLGVDGVLVDEIESGVVIGQGEWNPPGGWRPFRLSLTNGQLIADR